MLKQCSGRVGVKPPKARGPLVSSGTTAEYTCLVLALLQVLSHLVQTISFSGSIIYKEEQGGSGRGKKRKKTRKPFSPFYPLNQDWVARGCQLASLC